MDYKFKLKSFLAIAALSLVLFLCTGWIASISFYDAAWAEGIAFFAFTWLCLHKLKDKESFSYTLVLSAILLGRFVLELPVRIFDFSSSAISILVPIINIVAIFLAALSFWAKRSYVYAISIVVFILLNVLVHPYWIGSHQKVCGNRLAMSTTGLLKY